MQKAANWISLLLTVGFLFLSLIANMFTRHLWIGILLLAATAIGLIVAFCFPRRWGIAMLSTLGLASLVTIGWACTAPSFDQLTQDGDRMIAVFEQYRSSHGRYPQSLSEAGIKNEQTRYGAWSYQSDGPTFKLSLGDYGQDLFVIYYQSRNGHWEFDT
jgi:hypothetical protein